MGQYWNIVNLSNMHGIGGGGKLGEYLWLEQRDLVELIAKGPTTVPRSPVALSLEAQKNIVPPRYLTRALARKASGGKRGFFDKFPHELVRMIFEELTTFVDVFVFGLTCTFVWNCGEPIINRLYLEWFRPWAGQRLICVGDYIRDLPKTLCNEETLDGISAVFTRNRNRVRELGYDEERDDGPDPLALEDWEKEQGTRFGLR